MVLIVSAHVCDERWLLLLWFVVVTSSDGKTCGQTPHNWTSWNGEQLHSPHPCSASIIPGVSSTRVLHYSAGVHPMSFTGGIRREPPAKGITSNLTGSDCCQLALRRRNRSNTPSIGLVISLGLTRRNQISIKAEDDVVPWSRRRRLFPNRRVTHICSSLLHLKFGDDTITSVCDYFNLLTSAFHQNWSLVYNFSHQTKLRCAGPPPTTHTHNYIPKDGLVWVRRGFVIV